MKKSVFAAFTAIVAAASLAACGASSTPSATTAAATTAATEAATDATTAAATEAAAETSAAASGNFRTLDEIKQSGTVKIGVFSDKAPFGYVDDKGEYQGYDVYYAHRIADDLGVNVEFTSLDPASRVEYAADQYKADNTATLKVDLAESGIPSPKNFSATNDQAASKLTMNWSVPTPASIQNRETFENYDNWTINQFGDWTTYSSIKSGETGGLWGSQGMPFPHENELYNYIVFNPDAIQDGITSLR